MECKALNNLEQRIVDLERQLADCEFTSKYWEDQAELERSKSEQKDRLILERNYLDTTLLKIPM